MFALIWWVRLTNSYRHFAFIQYFTVCITYLNDIHKRCKAVKFHGCAALQVLYNVRYRFHNLKMSKLEAVQPETQKEILTAFDSLKHKLEYLNIKNKLFVGTSYLMCAINHLV